MLLFLSPLLCVFPPCSCIASPFNFMLLLHPHHIRTLVLVPPFFPRGIRVLCRVICLTKKRFVFFSCHHFISAL
ncbi:hypothetical protein V8C44DRAFT_315034 [Trichoderma aethiopicum]